MKKFGLLICVLGSLLACLYAPYNLMGQVHWGFLFQSIVAAFGKGVYVYDQIHYQTLAIELAAINTVGLALIWASKGKKRR